MANRIISRAVLAAALAGMAASSLAQTPGKPSDFDARLFDSPALATPYRDNLSDDEKVAGLSKFWSEVKYNFVYVDKLKQLDWDRLYLEYLPKVRATASTAEYYRVLAELCAKLQDGHTNVYAPAQLDDETMARPLLSTWLVEDRVLLRQVFDPALIKQGLAPGVEIVAVDGEPARAYAGRVLAPGVSASTPQDLDNRIYGLEFLMGSLKDAAPRLTLRDAAGNTFERAVPRVSWERFVAARGRAEPFELRMLPGNVAYVALNSFRDDRAADAFLAAFDRIKGASALVIDVRANSGGNSSVGYRVLQTLADKPFQPGKWATRQYLPAYRAWQRPLPDHEQVGEARAPDPAHHFGKPVAVLTSGATYSAAEDFEVAFDAMRRGILVGGATGGSTGQPLKVALPGGGIARICTKADTYADGRRWVGKGIAPDVVATPTVSDVRQGRDTVLETALVHLRK